MRRKLTDSYVRGLPRAEPGRRYSVWDTECRGMLVRVTDTGHKTLMYASRGFAGSRNPVRRAIGEHGKVLCEPAREIARSWAVLLKAGQDPRQEAEKSARRAALEKSATFSKALTDWEARHTASCRRGAEMVRLLRFDLEPVWRNRSVASLERSDITRELTRIKARGAVRVAQNAGRVLHNFLGWCLNEGTYGIAHHPMDYPRKLNLVKLLGRMGRRSRHCSDAEIRAWWLAADEMPYPKGPFLKLLLLLGVRRGELAGVTWRELDIEQGRWVLPAARHKSGRDVLVVLPTEALRIFETLPRWRYEPMGHVFSTTYGKKAMSNFGHIGARHRQKMLRHLGLDEWPDGGAPQWHDCRRTLRTNLSRLRVPFEVAEYCLSHKPQTGVVAHYDLWTYEAEMRDAMNRYAEFVRSLL